LQRKIIDEEEIEATVRRSWVPGLSATKRRASQPPEGTPYVLRRGGLMRLKLAGLVAGS